MTTDFSDEALQNYPLANIDRPSKWQRVAISEIAAEVGPGFASGKHNAIGSGVPHLRPMNVSRDGQIDLAVVKSVAGSDGVELLPGDVLFNNTNSPELIGKTALISERETGFAFSNHMTRIRLEREVSAAFVARQLHFLWMCGYMKHRCTNHVNQASISSRTLASSIPILLPPPAEQTRIVAKVEELLSDLDAGVAELTAAQKKLQQYRQSLLKAAVEGALSAEWREAQRQQGEPAETGAQLLARILTERRARWETKQLAKFKQQGKAPPQDWQKKYPEPVRPDTTDLPDLPEGWVWASADQLVAESSYGTSVKCSYESSRTPVLRIPNVSAGRLDLGDMKFAVEDPGLEENDYLAVGDVLVIRTNGSIGLVGRAAAVTNELPSPHYFASYLVRLRTVETTSVHRWLLASLSAQAGRQWLEHRAASSAGQHNISLSTLLTIPIPLPSIQEQTKVLDEVETRYQLIEEQATATDRSLLQTNAQRQNILRAAFAGRLVAQDPGDEPAERLLDRIRNERAERASQPKTRRPKRYAEA